MIFLACMKKTPLIKVNDKTISFNIFNVSEKYESNV